jgi:hypothetical protein
MDLGIHSNNAPERGQSEEWVGGYWRRVEPHTGSYKETLVGDTERARREGERVARLGGDGSSP